MSRAFGSMPADRELTACGTGIAGLFLGMVAGNLISAVVTQRLPPMLSPAPNWFSIVLGVVALAAALLVPSLALRVALVAFAATDLLPALSPAIRIPMPPPLAYVLYGTFAGSLAIAAWPRAGRVARALGVGLFVCMTAVRAYAGIHLAVFH